LRAPNAQGRWRRALTWAATQATILLIIILIYIVLGMFLKSLAMRVLTIPVVVPVAAALEWDLIWFGIIVVIALEKGLISPPVGGDYVHREVACVAA
jgi:TRAP-type C4-dicarboxylate transport system permease large subunit